MHKDRVLAASAVVGFLLVAAVAVPLRATQQPNVVAVVDNDRVFAESAPGRTAAEQIEANFAAWQNQLTQLEQELTNMVNQRNQQASVMTAESLRQIDAEIEQKQVDLQRLRDDAQRQFAQFRDQIIATLEETLTPQVQQLAGEMGYAVVFNTATPGLLYFDQTVDITDQLIARLNAMGQ